MAHLQAILEPGEPEMYARSAPIFDTLLGLKSRVSTYTHAPTRLLPGYAHDVDSFKGILMGFQR